MALWMDMRAYPKQTQIYKYALLLSIVFILYSGLIPFEFFFYPRRILRVVWRIMANPFWGSRWLSLNEVVRNILLFMPFGFFFYMYFDSIKKRKFLLLQTLLFGVIISLSVEITQLFFRDRITSVIDFINNSSGAFIGGLTAYVYRGVFEKRMRRFLRSLLENEPVTIIILIIIFSQLFASLVPFHFVTSASELKGNLKYCNVMPFGTKAFGLAWGAFIREGVMPGFSWLDFFESVLLYMMYGYLAIYAFKRYWRRGGWLKLILLLGVYFPALEIIKVFVESQSCDINHIISGYLGVSAGAGLFFLVKKPDWFQKKDGLPLDHFIWLVPVYLLFLFYSSWNPFHFSMNPDVLGMGFRLRNLLPFYRYFGVTSWTNTYNLFRAFFITMPLGAILAASWIRNDRKRPTLFSSVSVGVLFGLIIETGQILSIEHRADVTDVILAGLGCLAGVFLYNYYIDTFVNRDAQEIGGAGRDFKNERSDETPSRTE